MGDLYKRLSRLCEERGITGYRMCKDCHISVSVMTDLKMGRKDGLSAINTNKLADYFGVSVGYLLGTEQKEEATAGGDDLAYSERERMWIAAYRNAPEAIRNAVDGLLEPYKAQNPAASKTAG